MKASKQVWDNYNSDNQNKGSDQDIISMMQDIIDTVKTLETMYGRGSELVVLGLIDTYLNLKGIAEARNLVGQPRL